MNARWIVVYRGPMTCRRPHHLALLAVLAAPLLACPATSDDGDSANDGTETGAAALHCNLRDQSNCEDTPFLGDTVCVWHADTYRPVETDPCGVEATFGRCVEMPTGGAAGCPDNPRCGIEGESTIFARVYDDGGEVEFLVGGYCGIEPLAYERCAWAQGSVDMPGALEQGPSACDCWCNE